MRVLWSHPLRTGQLLLVPFALMPLAVALILPVPALCALSAIGSAGFLLSGTMTFAAIQRTVPENMLSRIISYDYFFSFLTVPLGVMGAGVLGSVIRARAALAAGGIGLVSVSLLCALLPPIWRFRIEPAALVAEPQA